MHNTLKKTESTTITPQPDSHPPIHLEYIRHLANISEDDGADQITQYHRAMFTHKHGAEQEQLKHQLNHSESRLEYLEPECCRVSEKVQAIEPLMPLNQNITEKEAPTQPWNGWDRWMFITSGLGVLCLVIFGVLNISFNLIESGWVIFGDHPYRAYFWAALLPVGALGIKIGWDMMASPRFKSIYVWGCLAAGFTGVIAWLLAYASIYPSLSMSPAEQLASIQLFNPAETSVSTVPFGNAKWMDMALVVSQSVAELFLSAALGIYMTLLYQKHRRIRPILRLEYLHWDEERLRLEESVLEERNRMAKARGRLKELDSQLTVYLSYAKSVYDEEVALNRNGHSRKERLLTELATDVMERLQTIHESRDHNHLIEEPTNPPTSLSTKTA